MDANHAMAMTAANVRLGFSSSKNIFNKFINFYILIVYRKGTK